jgi:hypothetical protein
MTQFLIGFLIVFIIFGGATKLGELLGETLADRWDDINWRFWRKKPTPVAPPAGGYTATMFSQVMKERYCEPIRAQLYAGQQFIVPIRRKSYWEITVAERLAQEKTMGDLLDECFA